MEKQYRDKLHLETLKTVAFSMGLYSDMTTKTLGFRWLEQLITTIESERGQETIHDVSALPISDVSKRCRSEAVEKGYKHCNVCSGEFCQDYR